MCGVRLRPRERVRRACLSLPVCARVCVVARLPAVCWGWRVGGGAARDGRRGLVYGCACGSAAVGQMGGSSPLPAEKVDSAMVLKPVTVEKRRAKTEPTRRHTVATPVRMGSARW